MTLPAFATCTQVAHVARVSVTVTARPFHTTTNYAQQPTVQAPPTAVVAEFTAVPCRACGGRLALIPGRVVVEVRDLRPGDPPSGRGIVVVCPGRKCHKTREVIVHGVRR